MFPDPLLLRDCGFDPFCPSVEGLTEQPPDAGRTQERWRDRAVAEAQRPRPGASPPQKEFTPLCSSSASGNMEKHNTRLAPGFIHPQRPCSSTSECGCSPGPTGALPLGDPLSLYQVSSQQGNCLSPCGLKTPGLHSAPGDSPFPPEHRQVWSCRAAAFELPLFMVLVEFKPSPFSFLPF